MQHKKKFKENGYLILRNFFSAEYINLIKEQSEKIFQIQFDRFGYNDTFTNNIIKLFEEQNEIFINCGKIIQTGLIELYKLPLEKKLINKIKTLGLSFPNLCTRPVLFFNHPKLAKEEFYYKTPPHQDWSSMLSSLDSVVVWVPLVDVNEENGSIVIWPKTHKLGPLPYNSVGGFASVKIEGETIQPKLNVGDIVIFSTLLVHSSGEITNNTIRWSCHYRFTNMEEIDFIKRGFPNPYVYKPITK
jgi:ectoine hydroxylase-related dioxygenase (phytanoyl-CoA dioxygenase family)